MSAVESNARALERLGAGDPVSVVEAAKRAALAVTEQIDAEDEQGTSDERIQRLLDRTSDPGEEFLALLYPLIEYGDARSLEVIPRCLLHIAEKTDTVRQNLEPNRLGGVVVVGRLIWGVVAYAIHCGRFDVMAEASRAVVRVPFSNDDAIALIGLTSLRYPNALGGNARLSFENYHDWLADLELIGQSYPLFSAEFDDVFREADVFLAMRSAADRGRAHSVALDTATVRRLARRLRDAKHRAAIAAVYAVTEAELDDVLELAYGALETDQRRLDRLPQTLFGLCAD